MNTLYLNCQNQKLRNSSRSVKTGATVELNSGEYFENVVLYRGALLDLQPGQILQ